MSCHLCENIIDRTDVPHVIKTCKECGRKLRVVELGAHSRGITIKDGESFVIPKGWLRMSLNPLKSTGTFFRSGIQWYAEEIFVENLFAKEENFEAELTAMEERADNILETSHLLEGLDINNPEHAESIYNKVKEAKGSIEWWALWMGTFLSISRTALSSRDFTQVNWAIACAERCRSMIVFKEHLEEVVWMGHSAKRIIDTLRIWESNKENDDEQFWQLTFQENTYVLSQVFAVPLVFVQDKPFVGGTKIDGTEGKFVDYLFSAESSREAILIEIKTPKTKLLSTEYRKDIFVPSRDLSGGLVQVLDCRRKLLQNFRQLFEGKDYEPELFNPKCVLLIGNAAAELIDVKSRESFELFRGSLKDVEVITYDELFRKVEILGRLFNLIKK